MTSKKTLKMRMPDLDHRFARKNVESCEVSFVSSFNFNILIIQLLTDYASYKKNHDDTPKCLVFEKNSLDV